MADNSAFISYRRGDGYPWARLIWDDLQGRSINAFLDLESMRQAGRFDERLLNQIAARPYFLIVLAEGSLDRCASKSDWVRREIEHAIETNRTIVPLFIAPFETSQFPLDLPPHIGEAIANSNGVTFYSQFLAAALDQLADFLQPVAVARGELTDDDAEFEQRVISEVRSLPPPIVPLTPATEAPPASEPPPDAADAASPIHTDMAREAEGSNGDRVPSPVDEASNTTTSGAVAAGAATVSSGGDTAPEQTGRTEERPPVVPVEPTRAPRRKGVVIACAVAVALVIGSIVALTFLGGDNEGDARTRDTSEVQPGTTDVGAVTTTTIVRTTEPDIRRTSLQPNEWLESGQSIATEDGELELRLSTEGGLELFHQGEVIWFGGRGPATTPEAAAVMGGDGNFVLYRNRREAETSQPPPPEASLFSSGTQGRAGAVLQLAHSAGDDAYVAVVLDGEILWRQPSPPEDPVTDEEDACEADSTGCDVPVATVVVPTLVGLPVAEAMQLLTEEGLVHRLDARPIEFGDSRAGTILQQGVPPGTTVDVGAEIPVVWGQQPDLSVVLERVMVLPGGSFPCGEPSDASPIEAYFRRLTIEDTELPPRVFAVSSNGFSADLESGVYEDIDVVLEQDQSGEYVLDVDGELWDEDNPGDHVVATFDWHESVLPGENSDGTTTFRIPAADLPAPPLYIEQNGIPENQAACTNVELIGSVRVVEV